MLQSIFDINNKIGTLNKIKNRTGYIFFLNSLSIADYLAKIYLYFCYIYNIYLIILIFKEIPSYFKDLFLFLRLPKDY